MSQLNNICRTEEEKKTAEGEDDFYEGLDTSVIAVAEELAAPMTPTPELNDEDEEPKKPVGPRVKVGPDGELIIDERSLVSFKTMF